MAPIESYSPATVERLSRQVALVIQRSGLVAIPTETFYGLGVNPFDARAVDRLRAVKGREDAKPILVLVGSVNDLSSFVEHVPPVASILIEVFWPGPLTILFPARASLPLALTAGTGLVGVRLSSCQPLCELLTRVGPLTGTSANRAGAAPARTAEAVQQALGDAVDLILDAGPTPGGLPSTVVHAHDSLRIVREGVIARSVIEARLQQRGFSLKSS
ncbi:MAG TPA: L-threonylcarbamoyladenylate synthase [Nitrospira sp.]|nr:L-threonylcarbamoyladenylate synthase [Nitrospira sp.]